MYETSERGALNVSQERKKGAPFIIINLDRPRVFRLGLTALKKLEMLLNMKITKLVEMDLGATEMISILWAGLERDAREHGDKGFTPDFVAELVDDHAEGGVMGIQAVIMQGMATAFGGGQDPNVQGPTKENPGTLTGPSNSPSADSNSTPETRAT